MTTLKDLLVDFQKEIIRTVEETPVRSNSDQAVLDEELENLVEEYTDIIKKRIVG